jgi:hypothetical protein
MTSRWIVVATVSRARKGTPKIHPDCVTSK